MKRKPHDQSEDAGSDSFLDIVSNIVGILIILVMIVGSRVTDYVIAEETKNRPPEAAAEEKVSPEKTRQTAAIDHCLARNGPQDAARVRQT